MDKRGRCKPVRRLVRLVPMPAKGLVICVPKYVPKAQEKAFGAMLRGLQKFLTLPRRSSVALSVAGCRMVFRARRAKRKRGQPPGPFVEFTHICEGRCGRNQQCVFYNFTTCRKILDCWCERKPRVEGLLETISVEWLKQQDSGNPEGNTWEYVQEPQMQDRGILKETTASYIRLK